MTTLKGNARRYQEKIEREHVGNMDVVNADLLNSNSTLPKTSFDVIYNSMVLHHITDIERFSPSGIRS